MAGSAASATKVATPPRAAPKPKKGKGSAVLLRVTQELRDALDARAAATGQSLAQIGEGLMAEALRREGAFSDLVGSTSAAVALEALGHVSRRVSAEVGDPAVDPRARHVLLAAWRRSLSRALPLGPQSPEEHRLDEARERLTAACAELLSAIRQRASTEPAVAELANAPTGWSLEEMGAAQVVATVGRRDRPTSDDLDHLHRALGYLRAIESLSGAAQGVEAAAHAYDGILGEVLHQAMLAAAQGNEIAVSALPTAATSALAILDKLQAPPELAYFQEHDRGMQRRQSTATAP